MAKHRLVTIGDSLSQGFMSGAIFATDSSFPALLAQELGLRADQFRYPSFNAFGGLPINLEYLLRRLEERYGPELGRLEQLGGPFFLRSWMDENEDYWERGLGSRPVRANGVYHNLASWGMTVDDALYLTAGACARRVSEPTRDNLFNQLPENAFYRTALRVLNPEQRPELMERTALGAAKALADDGGIENLVVWLGSNNALGTVTRLNVRPTDTRVLSDPIGTRSLFNLLRPEHFAPVYQQLAATIDTLDAERVFLCTVPHVTIAPLARGVGTAPQHRMPEDARYFRHYTYAWITDERFDPQRHPHLTGAQAAAIDRTIDSYNAVIKQVVATRREQGRAWFVIDLARVLDQLAYRRYHQRGDTPPGGYYDYPAGWTEALAEAGLPLLTTEYLTLERGKLLRGGLFSLDGVHPTTMGYALVAHEVMQAMRQAGVRFINPLTGRERPEPVEVDYRALLRRDTLVSHPPALLDDALGVLNWLEDWINLSSILGQVSG
jgi:hypothetical protein